MADLQLLLQAVAARHRHLCPRQVLGVRMALAGAAALGLAMPRRDRRMLVFVETDGCFADAVEVATGATVGRRTLRVVDCGKVAATFADAMTDEAVRIAPRATVRVDALHYAPEEHRRYYAQLVGYQRMPDDALLSIEHVYLDPPARTVLSRVGRYVHCAVCGEEINNRREVVRGDRILCRACAAQSYYRPPG